MRTSIWYRDEEKRPDKSGHYLAYRGFGMGGGSDTDHEYGYLYYSKQKNRWQEYQYGDDEVHFVYYWTDATPDDWTDSDPPRTQMQNTKITTNPALENAWKDVQTAVERYRMIKELVK